ncbi:MAG: TonB-system energizer ExbB [Chromatiaceae bacterium]|jgi:biopolymer transport protein ExbB
MQLLKDYLDLGIFGVLGSMSFLLLGFVIERFLYLRSVDIAQFDDETQLNVALTRNLTAIATIGANAPYVGLLGTVLGIIISFYDISRGGSIDTATIMLGLALALKATALGLVVAIPAIVFYNALVRKVEVLTAAWRRSRPQ